MSEMRWLRGRLDVVMLSGGGEVELRGDGIELMTLLTCHTILQNYHPSMGRRVDGVSERVEMGGTVVVRSL